MIPDEEWRRVLLDYRRSLNLISDTLQTSLEKAFEPLTSFTLPELCLTPELNLPPPMSIYTDERYGDCVDRTYWNQNTNWDDPNNPLGGVTVSETQTITIRCTPEEKEQVIKLAEEKWEKCIFKSGCDPQDDYDCRKCLERRVRWVIDGSTSEPL